MARPSCHRCGLHPNICVCDQCRRLPNTTAITVLQHPSEVGQSKGTLRILQQCLSHLQVCIGETPEALATAGLRLTPKPSATALLFPGDHSLPLEHARVAHIQHWLVLDGTWRKAAKLLHLNPLVANLPRYHFACPPASQYRIRKAPRAQQLSTAEAVRYLLHNLEPSLDLSPIDRAMDTLVARQLAQIPEELHRRYGKNPDS